MDVLAEMLNALDPGNREVSLVCIFDYICQLLDQINNYLEFIYDYNYFGVCTRIVK